MATTYTSSVGRQAGVERRLSAESQGGLREVEPPCPSLDSAPSGATLDVKRWWLGVVSFLIFGTLCSGCSVITGGYHECDTTAQCGAGRVCVQSYCVSVNCTQSYGNVDAGNAVVLGAALPLSSAAGPDQAQQVDFEAFLLALNEINLRFPGGRGFVVYGCDSEGDTTKLTTELSYLIDQKGAVAVLTSHSSQALAALNVTFPKNVLQMSATATSPELTSAQATASLPDGGSERLLWRTAPSDVLQGQVIANQILTNPRSDSYLNNVNRVGILYVDDAYGQGLSNAVVTALGTAKLVHPVQYPPGGNAANAVTDLNAFKPDLTVVIGFPSDLVPIFKMTANQTNLSNSAGHRWFLTDSAKDPALLTDPVAQAQVANALGTEPAQTVGPAYSTFSSRFRAQYGVDPANTSFTAHSYDAMYLLGLAAVYAGGPSPYAGAITGLTMAEGLRHVSAAPLTSTHYQLSPTDFTAAAAQLSQGNDVVVDGASGPLHFNPATGDAPGPIEIYRVSGSTFVTVTVVPPA